jgi:flagellin
VPRTPRRTITADQKAAIPRRHHVDKVPVFELCEQNDLQPSLFCYWQRQRFENTQKSATPSRALEAKVEALETRARHFLTLSEIISKNLCLMPESIAWSVRPSWPSETVMAITVKTNTAASNALTALNRTSRSLSRSFERISSGLRISRAADDAAGLGVAENLRAAHTSATVASRNLNDGVSIIAVAEGATNEVSNILVRMRELAVQSASETLGTEQRAYIQTEYTELADEVSRIAAVTEFNGQQLTNGAITFLDVQAGINATSNDRITITLGDLRATSLGVDPGSLSLSTAADASTALTTIDKALTAMNTFRATFGSVENRLGSALNNLETYIETTTAAESGIRDADFGYETAQLAQNQILQQAGVSVLTQAKGLNQAALGLLQG